MLVGSIASLGSQYVVTLDGINCATGDTLAEAQGRADSKEQVLKALDTASNEMRGKLGESLASIQKFDKPLEEATTSSLDALKAFTLGDVKHAAVDEIGAIPFFKRAVELNPNFAMAYARLGTIYGNLSETGLAEEYRKKAFDLKDRASERERLYITAHYYADSGQLEKGIAAYELFKQTYPREATPYTNLAVTYLFQLGEFEKALANGQEAVRVDPDDALGYFLSADAYMGLNRPDEAKTILKEGLKRNPVFLALHDGLAQIAVAQGDIAAMEKEEGFLHDDPYREMGVSSRHGDMAASHGQVRKAQEFYEKARQIAQRLEIKESEAGALDAEAWTQAIVQNQKQALESANAALGMSQDYNTRLFAAGDLALAGGSKKALELAADVARKRPDDTLVQVVDVPFVQAAAALSSGNGAKAVDILKVASPYDKGRTYVHYVRGLSYLKAGQGNEAAQEFQKILSLRNFAPADPVVSLAHLGLGRAYALQGDTVKTRAAYQDFFALWKDADPDIPILRQAKAEYAKLQ